MTPLRVLIVSWRDLDHPFAGGSEVLIARLAEGLGERGHDVTLLASGRTPTGQYRTVDAGGRLTQYLTDPLTARRLGRFDVVVDVCNGVPFFAPLWSAPRRSLWSTTSTSACGASGSRRWSHSSVRRSRRR